MRTVVTNEALCAVCYLSADVPAFCKRHYIDRGLFGVEILGAHGTLYSMGVSISPHQFDAVFAKLH